ncbi:hypothetical protein DRN85_01100 [Methanosarcinales archaeon]|nr:MAG: hypothetical protein DRN85_01100 [Methanosarcinales archaeon]
MITWTTEISIADLLLAASILIAAVGLFLNFLQMRKNNLQKRAEYMINLYNQYTSDPDMTDIYYKIEYGEFDYNEEFHQSSEEKKLDKLLGFFENIAKLYTMKNITLDDLKYSAYEFLVIYQDNSVKQYIRFLERWFSQRGIKVKPYEAFQKVGKILEKEMYSHESNVA